MSASLASDQDASFMRLALAEAERGAGEGEIPVGAVLVLGDEVLAKAHNRVERGKDPTLHAEMICIREAAKKLKAWRLLDCTLYVTLEPCPMCAGAILQSRIKRLVWGAPNTLLGADGSWIRMFPVSTADPVAESTNYVLGSPRACHPFHPEIKVTRGLLSAESAALMKSFFRRRRLENSFSGV
ncbi:tRNA arginine adenosine deaminase [Klebsormidium nitens]|uniref:tRNA(adenine(34)) deaminase n=1 Tax=Klebsormidium nitens TaxID=105231 RepID=A0A1Y1IEW6_KLENI|nr:tRNA arginine adenosine deaminase [Klebsormidium nitens]|eukprot:GAQ87257.1 tRNA arginine adenosine deaminase [Klebsormidium nitens]